MYNLLTTSPNPVLLSSIVITLSLSLAFSSWARTVLFGGFRLSYAFLAHRMATRRNKPPKKHLNGASAKALREFMLAKQKEWEDDKYGGGVRMQDLSHSSGAIVEGQLPLHRQGGGRRRSSGGWTGGQFSVGSVRFWGRGGRGFVED